MARHGEPAEPPAPVVWRVPPEAEGERLDRHAADHLDVARNQVQRWLAEGRVTVDGEPAKPSTPLAAGSEIEARPPPPTEDRIAPEEGELTLLLEDEHLAVVDKPAGLTVHPGAGRSTGTLAHRLLARYPETAGVGGPGRPGIVHRLDKDSSGAIVVARTDLAYRSLSRAFAERRVEKRYLAIVHGEPATEGSLDAPVGRHPNRRREMSVVRGGRPAVTLWTRLAGARSVSLLEVAIETGRTHQIRVHMKHLRHPLVGDPVYGEARHKSAPPAARRALAAFPRPALHAWRLAFPHPEDGRWVAVEAPVPEDLRRLWEEAAGRGWPKLPAWE